MAQLLVRNIDDEVVRRLRLRAAHHGRSAEAEHREILKTTLLPEKRKTRSLKALLLSMPDVGSDKDFGRSRQQERKINL